MAKVLLPAPYMHLSGKLNKSSENYFITRNGKTFMCHRSKKRSTPYSEAEMSSMCLFGEVNKQTTALLKDPPTRHNLEMEWRCSGKSRKCTLRGYVFSKLYKATKEELEREENAEK